MGLLKDESTSPGAPPAGSETAATPVIRSFCLGPFATNCYVVTPSGVAADLNAAGSPCWIVDAGYDPDELIGHIQARGLDPQAVILTHAHFDHIAGLFDVRRAFPGVPILMHEAERSWLNDPVLNLSALFGLEGTGPEADRFIDEGRTLKLGPDEWRVIHTPGHSPGGITLYHEPSKQALVGDTLFAGSIGRHDFPGSDGPLLLRSIREKLYALPDEVSIYPGHMAPTTIGREKRSNPYVRA